MMLRKSISAMDIFNEVMQEEKDEKEAKEYLEINIAIDSFHDKITEGSQK